ncbi:hypothetical protein BS47DRAFT_1289656 [Hydnum rufescens UP504]|uniref:Template-activating factor I n=1 Tax=Hydnum rufescens UP504 TaxID=1448309 RepID=A0A9P6B6T9_9AGAM|nr:hypothetical protein BS47DRAFT_1289656 [Hydnum rufescens UP504]
MSNPVHDRLELILEYEAAFRLEKVFEERRAVLKNIPGFWPTALHNHALLAAASGYADDQKALGFLQDVWVARNPRDHRAYTIEFHFDTNPFFHDAILKKEYKFVSPEEVASLSKEEYLASEAFLNYDQSRDTEASVYSINWKDPENALTKQYPRISNPEDPVVIDDLGSFFNIFEEKDADAELENQIAFDWFPNVIEYFFNRGENVKDEEDEEDGSDEEDIDLENPKKKAKK